MLSKVNVEAMLFRYLRTAGIHEISVLVESTDNRHLFDWLELKQMVEVSKFTLGWCG
jgi:hypothetical protein